MTSLILALFDPFSRLFQALGVDYAQFRAILEVKLTMDNRRQLNAFQGASTGKKQPKAIFFLTLVGYTFFGLYFGVIAALMPSTFTAMTLAHSFVMVMVGMSLVGDYSSVLLDTTDNAVMQPRPVTGRTLLVARVVHIALYLSLMSFSLSLCTMVVAAFKVHVLAPVVFAATLGLSMCLVVFLASTMYLLAMRVASAEKVRDIITWVQIILAVVMVGGYQVLPRMMGAQTLKSMSLEGATWVYFYPPAWFAAPIDLLAGHITLMNLFLSTEAVLIPVLAMLVVIRVLAPTFSQSMLDLEAQAPVKSVATPTAMRPATLSTRLARLICRNAEIQAAFEMVWQLCARDRQFKRRVYPSVAMMAVMAVALLFNPGGKSEPVLQQFRESSFYLFALYMASLPTATVIAQVALTEQPEAAWIYRLLPIARPGRIIVAGWKVMMMRIVVPVQIALLVVLFALIGSRMLLDGVVSACATLFIASLYGLAFGRQFPFSKPYSVMQQSGRMMRTFGLMFLPFVLCGLHYVFKWVPYGPIALMPVYLLLTYFVLKAIETTTWPDLLRDE